MAFGNRGTAVIGGQGFMQPDHRSLPEKIFPFLPSWASALSLWPAGALAHAMWGTDPTAVPWATAGLTLLGASLTALTAKVAGGSAGRKAHSVTSVGGASAWLIAATIAGPGTHPLLDMWLMGAPALALSWNVRRVFRSSEKDGENKSENQFFKAVKLAGTKVRGELEVGPNKVQIPLQLPSGELTADDVTQARGRIASGLSVPSNAVRVAPDPEHHDRATLVVVPQDMLKKPTPWAGPSHFGGSILDPLVVGIYEDGEQAQFWLPGDKATLRNATHALVMGMNGAGKSHGGKIAWTEILTRRDVCLWVADPAKGKQTLGPFLPYLDWAAMTPEEGDKMIAALKNVIRARASRLGELGMDQWTPASGMPYLVVWIEEAASLIRDSDEMTDIVQQARSAGISVIISLQRATFTNMPTDVRAQLGVSWCFGVKSEQDARFGLSEDTVEAGANPGQWQNKKPGYAYLEAPGIDDDRFVSPMRTFSTTDDQMITVMKAAASIRAELDPVTTKAAGSAYAKRTRHLDSTNTPAAPKTPSVPAQDVEAAAAGEHTTPTDFDAEAAYQMPENHEPELDHVDPDTELEPEDPAAVFDLPRQKITTEQALNLLRELLGKARALGAETIGPKDVPKEFFDQVRSRPWVSAQLGRLAELGELRETETEGRYAFPPADEDAA